MTASDDSAWRPAANKEFGLSRPDHEPAEAELRAGGPASESSVRVGVVQLGGVIAPMPRAVVHVIMSIAVAFVAIPLFVALIWGPQNAPAYALLACVPLAFVLGFVLYLQFRRRGRHAVRPEIQALAGADLQAIYSALAARFDTATAADDDRSVLRALIELGRRGDVALIAGQYAPRLGVPDPIQVAFEPTPVRESKRLRHALLAVGWRPAPVVTKSRIHRILTWISQWGSFGSGSRHHLGLSRAVRINAAVLLVGMLINWWCFRRLAFLGLSAMSALVIVATLLFEQAWGVDWFAVPGGLVVRRRRLFRPDRLHRFAAPSSLLALRSAADGGVGLTVAGDGATFRESLVADDAEVLLAGWLSPLPCPSHEQLADLAR